MNNQNAIIHKIERGDTLYNLAKKYNTTIETIMDANPYLNPYQLRVGDEIVIYVRQNGLEPMRLTKQKLDLMNNMRTLLDNQAIWTRQMLLSISHNLNDIDVINQKLIKNVTDIGNVFRLYYGDDIANRITNLLNEHILITRELFKSLKRADMTAVSDFNRQLYRNADDIAFTLDSINPYYIERDVREMLYQYLDLIRQMSSSRMGNNYAAEISLFDNVRKLSIIMADYLTNGLIEQFPKRFT